MNDGTSTIDGNEWQMHRWALGPHRREGVASCAWCPHGVKQERVDRLGAVVTLWLDVTSSTSLNGSRQSNVADAAYGLVYIARLRSSVFAYCTLSS